MSKRIASTGAQGDDLGAMIRAAGAEDAVAAASEFPYSEETLRRFVGGVRRRRAAGGAALALVLLPVLGAAVFGIGQLWKADSIAPIAPPSVSLSPSASPSASPSPSVSPSPTVSPSPAVTEPAPPPPAPPTPAVPGRVTVDAAFPSSLPGSIQVEWTVLPNATGYRVYRSASSSGPFTPSASVLYDEATGGTATTIEIGVPYERIGIGLYSSGSLTYWEIVDGQPACFRIAAFNSEGEGRRSDVVCVSPAAAEPSPVSEPDPDPTVSST